MTHSITPLYVGLDLGTSGARAVAIDDSVALLAQGSSLMKEHGDDHRDPATWWAAAEVALRSLLAQIDPAGIVALCVDGTSGTMLPISDKGEPLGRGLMYNDPCTDRSVLKTISALAPATSAAHGPTSGLARALLLQKTQHVRKVVHQADWIAGRLSGVFATDDNNALKTGYDPVLACWPDWMSGTGIDLSLLPEVNQPGTPVANVLPEIAKKFGLPADVVIVAGTTDGCASFLATGAEKAGDGVTALGTTLTIKILSDVPIFDPACGVYSHHILGNWLAGGASNTGGNVLLNHFTAEEMNLLSADIDPASDSGLDYYPLSRPGERFPIADPAYPPRMSPVPANRALFLQGLFEGIAGVEALAYAKIVELGGPALASIRSVGGGALNPVWSAIRERRLSMNMSASENNEAAVGAARLARFGMNK